MPQAASFPQSILAARAVVVNVLLRQARGMMLGWAWPPVPCPACGRPAKVFLSPPFWVYGLACTCGVRVSSATLEVFGRN